MTEGKVTLTCGHTNETPVCIWEPEIDREGNTCRSYSTYCPACAEDASFVMVERIEALEAEVARLREAQKPSASGEISWVGLEVFDHRKGEE